MGVNPYTLRWEGERYAPPTDKLGATLLIGDFNLLIKKLNDRLYVKTDERKEIAEGFWVTGIYYKEPERVISRYKNNKNAVHGQHEKYLNALEAGELDKFITGVCLNVVPEYDIFDLAYNRMLAPGWRKIVLKLVQHKLCTLEKARKVFKCSSLGEHDYDKMKFFQRLAWAKKQGEGEEEVDFEGNTHK